MSEHHHLQRIELTPARLARWLDNAVALGDAGVPLTMELLDLQKDPTRHRIMRAYKAAIHADRATTGDAKHIAMATAIELEEAAR